MANHLLFMKGIIVKPIFILKKDFKSGRRPSKLVPDAVDVYIDDIVEESIIDISTKNKQIVNRIFVGSSDGGKYTDVGWQLNDDVHFCMLCKTSFGMFTYKHHCKGCGNIVCQSCSESRAYINEIQSMGALRVCNLCYFGQVFAFLAFLFVAYILVQDIVYGVNNRPYKPPAPASIVTKTSKSDKQPSAEESEEEKRKKLRMQQQMAFQKEASRRISTLAPAARSSFQNVPESNGSVTTAQPTTAAPNNPNNLSAKIASSQAPPPINVGKNDFDKDNQARQNRLSKYGAMSTIVPTPGFVIKTKRNTGTKVFINICSHNSVPFKPETNSTANEVDPDKQLYMIISTPLEYQNEKDGSYCIIYDVVVHPDEVFVCTINSSGTARTRLCTQALELATKTYYENIDPSYVILRLASNYKGKDDAGKASVRAITVPPAEAFYALNQIGAVVTENSPSPAASSPKAGAVPRSAKEGSGKTDRRSVDSVNPDVLDLTRASSFSVGRSTIVDQLEAKSGFDSTLKVMILPRSELEELTSKNFNTVLEAMNRYEQDIKDMIIYPEPGFVILAQQIRPVRRVFINVCHHRVVGLKTPMPKQLRDIPRPCPFIIGNVDENYTDSSGKAMVVNIIIPSSVINVVVEDATGELRDQLAIEILQRLSSLNILLDSNFALPLIPGGYVSRTSSNSANPMIIVPPVLNLTEYEKTEFSVGFIGKLWKQGHRVKSWKERLVFFSEVKMQYFDMKMIYHGEFEFEDCSITNIQPSDCSAPNTTYPFQMKNFASGGEYLYCYVSTEILRELYKLILQVKNGHLNAIKVLINIPLMKTGWLKKQGHLIKNWKERFFILNYGILQYYENNGQDKQGVAETAKGKVNLKNATVSVVLNDDNGKTLDGDHRLLITEANGQKLLVQMKTAQEKKEWFEAIRKHIDYAKEYID